MDPIPHSLSELDQLRSALHASEARYLALQESVAREVSESRRIEALLRENEERFRLAFQTSPDAMSIARLDDGTFIAINAGFSSFSGWAEDEVIGRTSTAIGLWADAGERSRMVEAVRQQGSVRDLEVRLCRRDGQERIVLLSSQVLTRGQEPQMLCVCRDITERRLADQEHQLLQVQLRQSQKMEAVGLLAGGVAHDFNNLMTVIGNYADFLAEQLPEGGQQRDDVEQIRRAAERATSLTRQLLAFSRRQVMKPRRIEVNQLVADMDKMLRRLIGEHIELTSSLVSGRSTVEVDPHQLEQVLLNLAVNARDAMGAGGRLTIETLRVTLAGLQTARAAEIPPGSYVLLRVADTGSGMDKETQRRAFEPFFTTKGGLGTGLGLSTVYGIIKQSGGHIAVQSRPGAGASFRIYLPAVEGGASPEEEDLPAARPARGDETILLVEDDALVRETVRQLLCRSGFRVLAAEGGAEALRHVRDEPAAIDLLLSDMVMPQMDGRAVAREVLALRPAISVLFMTGYASSAIAENGQPWPGAELIEKPFTAQALIEKIRAVLERRRPARGPPRAGLPQAAAGEG